jgi:DNA-directed RNA polymerase subunit RPC12/RpoP
MPKACLSCGTVNPSNAKFCNKCGKPFSSKAGSGGGKRVRCEQCGGKLRLVKGGPFTGQFEPEGPINQYWEVWKYYVLECGHKYKTQKIREEDWKP